MSLDELRKSLSAVDREIVKLVAERQRLVGEIGRRELNAVKHKRTGDS